MGNENSGEDVRRPEPGEIFEWTDEPDLNQVQVRRLDSRNYLVILGHGPHDHRRTFVSVVVPRDEMAVLHSALDGDLFGSNAR